MTRKIAQGLIAGMRQSVRPEVLKLRDFVHGRPQADGRGQEHREPRRRREPSAARGLFQYPELSVGVFELASPLREFKNFIRVVGDAEETYMPGWPPMSPVSISFFAAWALFDLPVCEC